MFCPYFIKNYGTQFDHDSGRWNYKTKNVCYVLVKSFLKGEYWLGVPSTWYIPFGYIDIDDPVSTPPDHILDILNLKDSEYYKMSSPGYLKEGRIHIIYKPQYKSKIMNRNLYQDMIGPLIKSTGAQPFPWKNRLFRVPAGRNQHILDNNGIPLNHSTEEFMYFIDKLDYYETSEKITYQTSFLYDLIDNKTDPFASHTSTIEDSRTLEKHGLNSFHTRHDSCLTLAIFYYRNDLPPDKAIRRIKSIIRKKHNGYSEQINKGKWWFVDKEIEEIVYWVYDNFTGFYYPDSIHNFKTGLITPDYIKHAVEVFRGDWINIKRTIALFQYCHMRSFFPWIYIPFRAWNKIASCDNYIEYQNTLTKKGIITNIRNDYSVGRYSKSYKIALPKSFSNPITNDNRAVTDLDKLLLTTYGSQRDVVNALQLNRQLAWRLFKRS